jgi:ABC-type dipeptide/oligopeptide/nickel transport system permease component
MVRKQTNMIKYIIKRILMIFPMLFAVLIVTFLLAQMMAVDPNMGLVNIRMEPEDFKRELERIGFYDPLYIKLWKYLVNFFKGDWGTSYLVMKGTPVLDMINAIWPKTIELMIIPIVIVPIIAVKLGVTSAKHKNKNKDIIIRFIAILGAGFPVFFVAKLLQMIFFDLRTYTIGSVDIPLLYSNATSYIGYNPASIIPPPPVYTLSFFTVLIFAFVLIILLYKRVIKFKRRDHNRDKSKHLIYIILTSSLLITCSILLVFLINILFLNSYGTGFRIIDGILYNDQQYLWDTISHLILPVICMCFTSLAEITRQTRSSMLDVMDQDYIRTARAKGVEEKTVLNKHALRNALIPTSNLIIGGTAGALLGSLFVEVAFNYTGLGYFTISAITNGDYYVIQGILVFSTIIILVGTLVADIMYTIIDPRITYN